LIALDAGVTILGDKLMLANGMDLKTRPFGIVRGRVCEGRLTLNPRGLPRKRSPEPQPVTAGPAGRFPAALGQGDPEPNPLVGACHQFYGLFLRRDGAIPLATPSSNSASGQAAAEAIQDDPTVVGEVVRAKAGPRPSI
jgi:hypothetical protein